MGRQVTHPPWSRAERASATGRRLTPRSTGPATAGSVSLARSGYATVARQAYTARLRGPVSSNVRLQNSKSLSPQQEVRLSAWAEQPRSGQTADFTTRPHAVTSQGRSPLKSKQPDFSRGRRERRPVQRHEEAARGGNCTQHASSVTRSCGTVTERGSPTRLRIAGISEMRNSRIQEFKDVVSVARHRAPCKVLSMRRRRGVPRLLLR